METNAKNLRDFIRKEYELVTDANGFAYGWLLRQDSVEKLQELSRIVRAFSLGDDLERDLLQARWRLEDYIVEHKLNGYEKYTISYKERNN